MTNTRDMDRESFEVWLEESGWGSCKNRYPNLANALGESWQAANARLLPVLEMAREALAYAWERYYMKADGSDALKQPFDLQVIIDALHAIHPIIPNAAINEVLGKE